MRRRERAQSLLRALKARAFIARRASLPPPLRSIREPVGEFVRDLVGHTLRQVAQF
jgi:hypothetical protein